MCGESNKFAKKLYFFKEKECGNFMDGITICVKYS